MATSERLHRLIEILHDRLDRLSVIVAREQKESLEELLFLEKSAFLELSRELNTKGDVDSQLVLQLAEIVNKIENLSQIVGSVLSDLERKMICTNDKVKKIRKYSSSRDSQNILSKTV